MSTRNSRDRWSAFTVGAALVILAVGFALAWFYMQYRERLSAEVSFLMLPPIAISHSGHSMSATVAVQTSAADAGWAADNKRVLEQVVKRVLMDADPQKVAGAPTAPAGLDALQKTLRDASNAELQTTRVQDMLLTEFLVSEGDF
ncbi:hypothetical protein GCM10027343_15300 [Noviherbaspirillum agri]